MHMTIRVAVAGASGYVGGEVLRVFSAHPEVEFGALTAHASVGERVGAHHPHLRALADRNFQETSPETLAGHDVVVLALPHGASGPIADALAPETLVLDCGADHRLSDKGAWDEYYGGAYSGSWPYGLPELMLTGGGRQRAALQGSMRVAVPGCNVTAVTLALQPGIAAGLVDPAGIVAVLANGYSGAGKALKTHLLASEGLGAAVPYAVGGTHRHIPEILQNFAATGAAGTRISFTPTLVPMSRGILATVTAPALPGATPESVRAAWELAYANEAFVDVLLDGEWPSTASTLGANMALIGVGLDEKAGRVVAICAIDNLVKGTAGAALQCMNLALGLPEGTGLETMGVAP